VNDESAAPWTGQQVVHKCADMMVVQSRQITVLADLLNSVATNTPGLPPQVGNDLLVVAGQARITSGLGEAYARRLRHVVVPGEPV
jgi:hypothetical protein